MNYTAFFKDFSMRIRWIIDHPQQYRVTGNTVKIWMECINDNHSKE